MIVRALRADETDLVQPLATRAFDDLDRRLGRPARPIDEDTAASYRAMHAHLRRTDPGGCLLAVEDDDPVGVALSCVRGDLWLLSLLVVEPDRQSSGAGSALLAAALAGAPRRRLLHATIDTRALRAYTRAGFRLLPSMSLEGTAATGGPPLVDAPLGGPLGPDLEHVRSTGGSIRCLAADPEGGRGRVAVVGPPGPTSVSVLDPVDEESGTALLTGALAELDRPVQVGPYAPQEHWAVVAGLRAGLQVRPSGPVAMSGIADPLAGVAAPASIYL